MAFLRFSIPNRFFERKRGIFTLKLLWFTLSVFIFCEFLIYYIVIIHCHWPQLKSQSPRASEQTSEFVLKAMFLADTHLLGEINGHWLDKLRREWQMERAFQTALWLLQPEIVFILGDVFDEGKWSSSQAWSDDVRRFQKMFRHPAQTELIVIVGNHDIGFHYEMNAFKLERFSKVFNFTSEKLITRKGINFVMVNSVALEGDGCMICRTAEAKLAELSHKLNCSLQHYPLYRRSDSKCTGEDSAPLDKKNDLFREKYDVLSQEASQQLLWWFHPRLILSGHTHSACEVLHNGRILEISVPSFSWRNRNNPSFIMGSISSTDFSLYKCFLPCENTVITIYCTAGVVFVVFTLAHFLPFTSPFHFVQHLITKYKAL
ncbi:metallophosphoesterase 1 isoform X2 [Sceloporus undulatus]|uniref:metallophosphoesterase 1 isoform X2 n=1 Tax=Sceloporus undulatus TaxID=8520 RepID=UPI001C4A9853|nr:metallophosphoesterase 1 isoform X2 [Sceloporus undulatus]